MKTIVIGCGVIGITTAYFLRMKGHEVTVIDRAAGPGLETSFANGALLTPSMAEPWNSPGCWRVLLASLGRSDSPMQLRWRALPSLVGWGISFLRNSRADIFARNGLSNLRLASYSLKAMRELTHDTSIQYGARELGTLRIFRDLQSLENAAHEAERLRPHGISARRLSRKEIVDVEPALEPVSAGLKGAMHYESDGSGDAHRFCVSLAELARQHGVTFVFGSRVASLELRSGKIAAARTDTEQFVGDWYVVAAGSYSTPLLKTAGLNLPVRPAKGYSVTFELQGQPPLRIPVVDNDLHAAVVPLDGALRVAGTAEFAGYDLSLNSERIDNLGRLLHEVLPDSQFDARKGRRWCGLRPVSLDGVPIIGGTPISNLIINTGHGHLGWTLAVGSARLVIELMSGTSPPLDPSPYSFARFHAA